MFLKEMPIREIHLYQQGFMNLFYEGAVHENDTFEIYGKTPSDLELIFSTIQISGDKNQPVIIKIKNHSKEQFLRNMEKAIEENLLTNDLVSISNILIYWNSLIGKKIFVKLDNGDVEGILVNVFFSEYSTNKSPIIYIYNELKEEFQKINIDEIKQFGFPTEDNKVAIQNQIMNYSSKLSGEINKGYKKVEILNNHNFYWDKYLEISFTKDGIYKFNYIRECPIWKVNYRLVENILNADLIIKNHLYFPIPACKIKIFHSSKKALTAPLTEEIYVPNTAYSLEYSDNSMNYFKSLKDQSVIHSSIQKIKFKLSGVPPDQALKTIEINPELTVEEIKRKIAREYRLNPIMNLNLNVKGKKLQNHSKLRQCMLDFSEIVNIFPSDEDSEELNQESAVSQSNNTASEPSTSQFQVKNDYSIDLFNENEIKPNEIHRIVMISKDMTPHHSLKKVFSPGVNKEIYDTLILKNTLDFPLEAGPITIFQTNTYNGSSMLKAVNPHQIQMVFLHTSPNLSVSFEKFLTSEPTSNISIEKSNVRLDEELSSDDYENIVNLSIMLNYHVKHEIRITNSEMNKNEQVIISYSNSNEYNFNSMTINGKEYSVDPKINFNVEKLADYFLFKIDLNSNSETKVEFYRSYIMPMRLKLDLKLDASPLYPNHYKNLPEEIRQIFKSMYEVIGKINKARTSKKFDKEQELKKEYDLLRLSLARSIAKRDIGM